MQLTGDESGVQVDFPLITARQRGLETKIRDVASRANLEVIDNSGSDGSRFLDLNVNGAPAHVAAICSKLLRGVFGISGDVELVFEHEGLAPSNTT